jgi:hypothetical protein
MRRGGVRCLVCTTFAHVQDDKVSPLPLWPALYLPIACFLATPSHAGLTELVTVDRATAMAF